MEAGEGRVCVFGLALEGLLGRIAERGAGGRVGGSGCGSDLPRFLGFGDLRKHR